MFLRVTPGFIWSTSQIPSGCLWARLSAHLDCVSGVLQIVWVAVLTFVNEILLGPQGILNLLQRKAEL